MTHLENVASVPRLKDTLPGIISALLLCVVTNTAAQDPQLGDLDGDRVPTVRDVALLNGHINATAPLSGELAVLADLNQDGAINAEDRAELVAEILETRTPENLPLSTIRFTSPEEGESDVAVTRETIVHFTIPLSPAAALDTTHFFAEFGGRRILSRVEIASDRRKATLFYLEPLPANARIQVTFDGASAGLTDLLGRPFDADGDGTAGGVYRSTFDTVAIRGITGTAMVGRVFASTQNASGAGNTLDVPLEGVTITVDGAEEDLRAVTDANGNFTLSPCPVGPFFVQIDGRTSPESDYPDGDYFPVVGKLWHAEAGKLDNLPTETGNIYLPCICDDTLQPVSATNDVTVEFPPGVLAENPDLAGTEITVPANSLFGNDGTRGGRVGIAPVAPDRIPSPLPQGLDLPLVITIQTDGGTNFDRPVPICLPNLPDPETGERLPPGAKSALWSFNHDIGDWEIAGPMTVTEDGLFVKSDPGVGVRQPGWHGTRSGAQTSPTSPVTPDGTEQIGDLQCIKIKALIDYYAGRVRTDPILDGGGFLNDGLLRFFGEESPLASYALEFVDTALTWADTRRTCQEGLFTFDECRTFLAGEYLILGSSRIPYVGSLIEADADYQKLKASLQIWENSGCASEYGVIRPTLFTPPPSGIQIGALEDQIDLSRAFQLQESYIQAVNSFTVAFSGSDIWIPTSTEEIFDLKRVYLHVIANAADGEVSSDERNDILAHPRPQNIEESDIDDLIQRAIGFKNGTHPSTVYDVVLDAMQIVESADNALVEAGVDDPNLFFAKSLPKLSTDISESLNAIETRQVRKDFYFKISDFDGNLISRGRSKSGSIPSQFVAPRSRLLCECYEPLSNSIGTAITEISRNGRLLSIPRMIITEISSEDSDSDGVEDIAEEIVGTDPENSDSDFDGISDLTELRQGSNPLDDIAATTGALTTISTSGLSVDVCAADGLAITADGTAGISIFNVFSGLTPVRVAEVDTPGGVTAVACSAGFVVAADSSAGIAIIDISEPQFSFLRHQIATSDPVIAVAAAGPIGYAGTIGGEIVEFDLATGIPLRSLTLPGGEISDLGLSGETLYATQGNNLKAISLDSADLEIAATASSPGTLQWPARIFAGTNFLYTTFRGGFNLYDLSGDSSNPSFVRQHVAFGSQNGWKRIVANGSGLALAAASPNPFLRNGSHDIDLYAVGLDGLGSQFLTTFPTPGNAMSVAIQNGLAYVADLEAGLTVVNFRPWDTLGVAPTISLASNYPLFDEVAEEGALMRLSAITSDDIQVRSVEFFVDGVSRFTDGNYPFEFRFVTPFLDGSRTSFTVRARAVDTGGNETWSQEHVLELVPDIRPPQLRFLVPAEDTVLSHIPNVYAVFTEPLDPATLSPDAIRLEEAGPDRTFDTADDVLVSASGSPAEQFREETYTFFYRENHPLPTGRYRFSVGPPAADWAGNLIQESATATFFVPSDVDTDGDGIPDDWEEILGLNPNEPDSDGDGTLDGDDDHDADGLSNLGELQLGRDPRLSDTDGNGISDGDEDTDNDGLSDGDEIAAGTDVGRHDTDGDGFDDGTELVEGMNPLSLDQPGASNASSMATSFLNIRPPTDSDGDGFDDTTETLEGWDTGSAEPISFSVTSDSASYLNVRPPVDSDGDGFDDATEIHEGWSTDSGDAISYTISSDSTSFLNIRSVIDLDDDGLDDATEILEGLDPNDPSILLHRIGSDAASYLNSP